MTNSPNRTKFTQKFINSLKELPGRYSDSPDSYDSFLDTFGTHYFETVVMGTSLFQQTLISADYLYRDDLSNIKIKAVELFLEQVDPVEFNKTEKFLDQKYLTNTENRFYKLGSEIPWIYSGSLRSIEELIPDANIKSQLKRAIEIKNVKAQFEELQNLVNFSGVELVGKEAKLLEHIKNYLEQGFYHQFGDLRIVEQKIGEVWRKANEIKGKI